MFHRHNLPCVVAVFDATHHELIREPVKDWRCSVRLGLPLILLLWKKPLKKIESIALRWLLEVLDAFLRRHDLFQMLPAHHPLYRIVSKLGPSVNNKEMTIVSFH